MEWKERDSRFVIFIDILGFKDLVARESHDNVLKKLSSLTDTLDMLSHETTHSYLKKKKEKIEKDQTKAITFSDSIIIFSKSDTEDDAFKILCDAHALQRAALKNNIPIKGAISFGEITVDFSKSLFFGQPIIDAYLLHDDLQMLSIVFDHLAENKMNSFNNSLNEVYNNISIYNSKTKHGGITHALLRLSNSNIEEGLEDIKNLYKTVSGRPRIYIDNTIQFYNNLLLQIKKPTPKKDRKK